LTGETRRAAELAPRSGRALLGVAVSDSGPEIARLTSNLYLCAEPVMMLERAGFSEVEVRDE